MAANLVSKFARRNPSFAPRYNLRNMSASKGASQYVDNPCWGSPTSCQLSDLLRLVQKSDAILYESPNYLVLNKPADLRMDGEAPSTVHKLLTFWYPTPSLLEMAGLRRPPDHDSDGGDDAKLLEAVSKLHQHNHLPDNEVRPCHQLDYATSGVLLVARSAEAAAASTRIFEQRTAKKYYSAIWRGHVGADFFKQLPVISKDVMETTLVASELPFRKKYRQQRRSQTFSGFQPSHSIFCKWKSQYKSVHESEDKKIEKKRKRKWTPDQELKKEDWDKIWEPLQGINVEPLLTLGWKEARRDPKTKHAFQKAANIHNDILREILEDSTACESQATLPLVFRLESDDDDNNNTEVFYTWVPLGDDSDSFQMKVPPTLDLFEGRNNIVESAYMALKGNEGLNFKPSLTQCEVIERGSYKGRPVTKVKLYPRTGRRHQLRVHSALLGHPILGDVTYDIRLENLSGEGTRDTFYDPPRMCLHAQHLSMNGLLGEVDDWEVTSSDPFIFDPESAGVLVEPKAFTK